MIATEGSGKWVFSVFFAILLVVTLCYPHQVLFMLKFLWDLLVLNVLPFMHEMIQDITKHWPF